MVTVPLDFGSDFTGTLEALLADQGAFGPYDPLKWRAFCYLPDEKKYSELNDRNHADAHFVAPGRAFWLISKDNYRIDTAPIQGTSVPTDEPYAVMLAPGWNLIGSPFDFPVAWDSVQVDSVSTADDTLVTGPIRWNPSQGAYYGADATMLDPFEGYWVHNGGTSAVTLAIPPVERAATSPSAVAHARGASESEGWSIRLHVRTQDVADEAVIGAAPAARRRWDRLDRVDPPMGPGRGVTLYVRNDGWGSRGSAFARDIRPALQDASGDDGEVWYMDVAKSFRDESAGDVVRLHTDVTNETQGLLMILVDRRLGRRIDLTRESTYEFVLGAKAVVTKEDDARFVVLVGSEEFVAAHQDLLPAYPGRTVLHQNYPNPFNPSTVVRYDLAAPAQVDLRIFNAQGALIKVLDNEYRQPGRYEVGWNGDNERGEHVASGVYFFRLRAGRFTETRKMVMLK